MISSPLLGHYNEPEDLTVEYKALHLYPHSLSNISDDDIFDYVRTGKWTLEFSELVESNLIELIANKVPKYVACYSNAKVDGYLIFGIDDSCEISGIPTITSIPRDKIVAAIQKTLKENIKSPLSSEELLKKIKIEYIPLSIDNEILTDEAETHYSKYSRDILDYNDKLDEYYEKHALFLIQHRKYSQKLETLLNTRKYRLELIDFISRHSTSCDHLIRELKSDIKIQLKNENIHYDRENQNRMFYWIAQFREMKNKQISATKPEKPSHTSIYHPRQILSNLPYMRLKFIKSNPNIKYYMIKITLNVSSIGTNVTFRDTFNKKWLHRIRTNESLNGPSCF